MFYSVSSLYFSFFLFLSDNSLLNFPAWQATTLPQHTQNSTNTASTTSSQPPPISTAFSTSDLPLSAAALQGPPPGPLSPSQQEKLNETLNFIHRFYCRECRMEEQRRKTSHPLTMTSQATTAGGTQVRDSPSRCSLSSVASQQSVSSDGDATSGRTSEDGTPVSPQTALDEASLQQAMTVNKECKCSSLKLSQDCCLCEPQHT